MKWLVAMGILGTAVMSGGAHSRAQAAETEAYRVVFEVTSGDTATWEGVLNNVENLRKALAPSALEIVAHSDALAMLTVAKSGASRDRMERLASAGVVFAACENTMRREGVKREDLLPLATTVDSGVAEIVRRQEQRWAYLRSGP